MQRKMREYDELKQEYEESKKKILNDILCGLLQK